MTTRYQQACERGAAMIGVIVDLAFELERIASEHPGILHPEWKHYLGLSYSEPKLKRMVAKDAKELRAAYVEGGLGAKKYADFTRRQFERVCDLRHNA